MSRLFLGPFLPQAVECCRKLLEQYGSVAKLVTHSRWKFCGVLGHSLRVAQVPLAGQRLARDGAKQLRSRNVRRTGRGTPVSKNDMETVSKLLDYLHSNLSPVRECLVQNAVALRLCVPGTLSTQPG